MTTTKYYQNIRNRNKYLEVRNDGHYHNTVRQFIIHRWCNGRNYTGDRCLHRWRINNLHELLEDYELVKGDIK